MLGGVRRAVGIELDPDRHRLAAAMLASATQSSFIRPDEASRVKFVHGDAFVPRAFQGATVIYMLSNVFPSEVHAPAHPKKRIVQRSFFSFCALRHQAHRCMPPLRHHHHYQTTIIFPQNT